MIDKNKKEKQQKNFKWSSKCAENLYEYFFYRINWFQML